MLCSCAQMNEVEKTLRQYNKSDLTCKVWFDNENVVLKREYPYTFESLKWQKRNINEAGQSLSIMPIDHRIYNVQFFAKTKELVKEVRKNEKDQLYSAYIEKEHMLKLNSQNNNLYKEGLVYEEEFEIVLENKKSIYVKNKIYCKR